MQRFRVFISSIQAICVTSFFISCEKVLLIEWCFQFSFHTRNIINYVLYVIAFFIRLPSNDSKWRVCRDIDRKPPSIAKSPSSTLPKRRVFQSIFDLWENGYWSYFSNEDSLNLNWKKISGWVGVEFEQNERHWVYSIQAMWITVWKQKNMYV